jgi:hypothetical protein
MRSFTPRILAVASLLAIVPLASAQARSSALDQNDTAAGFHGPRLSAVIDQVDGVRQGIADARQGKEIGSTQARMLEMRADRIGRTAERIATADHGRISTARYHRLLRRLDNVDHRLMNETGGDFPIGNGADGGSYPNG